MQLQADQHIPQEAPTSTLWLSGTDRGTRESIPNADDPNNCSLKRSPAAMGLGGSTGVRWGLEGVFLGGGPPIRGSNWASLGYQLGAG